LIEKTQKQTEEKKKKKKRKGELEVYSRRCLEEKM